MARHTLSIVVVAVFVVGASWASQDVVSAATPQAAVSQQQHKEHHPEADDQAELEPQEHQMMQRHQAMMAEMNVMDAKLNELVASMNAATGEAKVTAMAEAVTTLAQQRMTMQERMMAMQGQMMGHMMQHLTQGMSSEGKASAAMCPMMRMMAGSHQEAESAEPSPQ